MDMRFRSLLTLTFALLSLATSALHAQVTAIRAGTLIDPVSGRAARDQIILVEGTTVKALGAKVAIPRGAAVIDLSGSDDQHYIYTPEDIRFVVDEAAKSGLKVAAHVWTKAGAHNAAGAGVASMEHLNGISDEDLALAKRNGVVAVFTFPGPPAGRWRSPGSTATSTRVSRPRRSFRR
jgi:imidazolonepropionase-like amidohydrolase